MNRISVEDALKIAEESFPFGPEKLVELLEVEVRRCAFNGEGWCLKMGNDASVMINSNSPTVRQRFTLAHELGHLILDIPSVIGEVIGELNDTSPAEEKRVNELAQQILLPSSVARKAVPELPVPLQVVESLAKNAKVSPVFVARRLTSLSDELGLLRAAVIQFEHAKYKWHYSQNSTVRITPVSAQSLLNKCQQAPSQTLTVVRDRTKDVLVATLFSNPRLSLHTVWMQVVSQSDYAAESSKDLENRLLKGYEELRPSLQGSLSGMKNKSALMTLEDALDFFNERHLGNSHRWNTDFCARLLSPDGQRYLRLRLGAWTQD